MIGVQMFLLRDLCETLTEEDIFAGAALRKAIEAAETATIDAEQQLGLAIILLAKSIGGTERKILEMISSSEGALAGLNEK
jgi:hypothetical protein